MNDQQIKFTSERKVIVSIILGIVNTISTFFILLLLISSSFNTLFPLLEPPFVDSIFIAGILLSPFFIIIGIIGLILGVKSLKSTKRKLAIWGILLNIIGLGGAIFLFFPYGVGWWLALFIGD